MLWSLWLLLPRPTVVHLPLLPGSSLIMRDIVVCHAFAGSPFVVDRFIVVIMFGVVGNNIPCVQQPRKVAEAAESNVYKGVGCTDAGFNPYCSFYVLAKVSGREG